MHDVLDVLVAPHAVDELTHEGRASFGRPDSREGANRVLVGFESRTNLGRERLVPAPQTPALVAELSHHPMRAMTLAVTPKLLCRLWL